MGTLRSRGQNEQKRKETNAEGGSTKYQTIVFQKQNGGIPQQISASEHRHTPPLPPLLFPPCVLALLRHSRPMLAPGIPKTAGSNTNFTKHTLWPCIYTHTHKITRFHKLQAWEHLGRLSLVSTWHKSSRGFPSLCSKTMFQCGCTGNVWVTWHWEYSSSFHCDKLGLHAQHHHTVQRNSNVERCGRT